MTENGISIKDAEQGLHEKHTVVALGMFDGMHIGHKKLIDTAVLIANSRGLVPAVYTFSNHPQETFGVNVKRLCTNDMRRSIMRTLGIVRVEEVEFTGSIRSSSPERFIELLIRTMNPDVIVAGFNYTFGRGKTGNSDLLQKLAFKNGVDAAIIPSVHIGKQPVSSTRIRSMIEKGDVKNAQELLGRAYSLEGVVCENKRMGHLIGFPTANIELDMRLVLPADGVYITLAEVMGFAYPAVTNIGSNPTVGGTKTTVETHILSFDEDIYGQKLNVRFVKRLRPVRKFGSIEELKAQIEMDTHSAKDYFGGIR
ncbi:MAG: bifunctional riboflavin kinase/FAD synthetase [Christensenellaceae bacterium]|nr:bifunctional riboflavin kinase/FAD synthetase [Christensenellaceae bacterium]